MKGFVPEEDLRWMEGPCVTAAPLTSGWEHREPMGSHSGERSTSLRLDIEAVKSISKSTPTHEIEPLGRTRGLQRVVAKRKSTTKTVKNAFLFVLQHV